MKGWKPTRSYEARCKLAVVEPGDGTHYEVLFTWTDDSLPGAGRPVVISLLNLTGKTYVLPCDLGAIHVTYVMEKFGLGEASARVVAEIIGEVLCWEHPDYDEWCRLVRDPVLRGEEPSDE